MSFQAKLGLNSTSGEISAEKIAADWKRLRSKYFVEGKVPRDDVILDKVDRKISQMNRIGGSRALRSHFSGSIRSHIITLGFKRTHPGF